MVLVLAIDAYLTDALGMDPEALIAVAKADLPPMIQAVADGVGTYSTFWYNDLAPDEPYVAELPDGELITEARIHSSVEWAIHTAAKRAL